MRAISAGAANHAAGSLGGVGKDKDKGKGSASGTGAASTKAYKAPGSAQAADKQFKQEGGSIQNGRAVRTENGPGGGTTTQWAQSPGATPNYPDASNPLGNLLEGAAIGPTGAAAAAIAQGTGINKALGRDDNPFTDTGPQKGWQPDKYRGSASIGGIGGDGGAVNSGDDEREIAGAPLGAGTLALTGDTPESGAGTDALYSDVTLRDRRKPRPDMGAGTLMALGL